MSRIHETSPKTPRPWMRVMKPYSRSCDTLNKVQSLHVTKIRLAITSPTYKTPAPSTRRVVVAAYFTANITMFIPPLPEAWLAPMDLVSTEG